MSTVADLGQRRANRDAGVVSAIARHPSTLNQQSLPRIDDPAATLTQVAREWDRLHRDLTAGPGALPYDAGYEALQVMVSALVHPIARAGLVLTWTQVLEAVRRHDQVMDGDLVPDDLGCLSIAEAIAKTSAELDWQLFPLIHGLPSRDACTDCVRLSESVNRWQPRLGCTDHQQVR